MNNDLISREALKEEFRNNCFHNCYYCKLVKWDKKGVCHICGLIDKAPPITDHSRELVQKSIEIGYRVGCFEGKIENKRPHGKWIKIFENPFTNGYVCPFCGHKIQVTEQFLPIVTECEVCGAEMNGEEAKK